MFISLWTSCPTALIYILLGQVATSLARTELTNCPRLAWAVHLAGAYLYYKHLKNLEVVLFLLIDNL